MLHQIAARRGLSPHAPQMVSESIDRLHHITFSIAEPHETAAGKTGLRKRNAPVFTHSVCERTVIFQPFSTAVHGIEFSTVVKITIISNCCTIPHDFLHQVHTIVFQIKTVVTVMRHVPVAVGKIDLTLKFTPKDWH